MAAPQTMYMLEVISTGVPTGSRRQGSRNERAERRPRRAMEEHDDHRSRAAKEAEAHAGGRKGGETIQRGHQECHGRCHGRERIVQPATEQEGGTGGNLISQQFRGWSKAEPREEKRTQAWAEQKQASYARRKERSGI